MSKKSLPLSITAAESLCSYTAQEESMRTSHVSYHIRDIPKSNLFVEDLPLELASSPYFLAFIGCRIAVTNNVSLRDVMPKMDFSQARKNPTLFWNSFDEHLQTLPRDPSAVWAAAACAFEGYTFRGKVKFESAHSRPVFKLDLLPIQAERSCLFQRMFGSDRFLYLTFPSIQDKPGRFTKDQMSQIEAQLNLWMNTSHSFLGRKWRVFNVKQPKTKKSYYRRFEDDVPGMHVILFATEGTDIKNAMSVGEMINVFYNFKRNQDENFCKAFDRLDLGLTKTIPTLTFKHSEIRPIEDVRADLTPEAHLFNDPDLNWEKPCDERACDE